MNKIVPLNELVSAHLHDHDTIFVGGFGQCIPFAIAHEIVRQGRKGLALCRTGADIAFDLMIASGCVKKVMVGYLGNPGMGLAHAFRRAAEAGAIEIEDWTNFSMVLRLHAAALGVPFLPASTMAGGDLPRGVGIQKVTCPYTRQELTAIPALSPDVAILHVQCADSEGNLQLFGLPGDSVDGALASKRIIATAEQIVSSEAIRKQSDRTVISGFMVAGVSHVPFGAYPSYVHGHYGRDDDAYSDWDVLSRDEAKLAGWIKSHIYDVADFAAYLNLLEPGRLDAMVRSAPEFGTMV